MIRRSCDKEYYINRQKAFINHLINLLARHQFLKIACQLEKAFSLLKVIESELQAYLSATEGRGWYGHCLALIQAASDVQEQGGVHDSDHFLHAIRDLLKIYSSFWALGNFSFPKALPRASNWVFVPPFRKNCSSPKQQKLSTISLKLPYILTPFVNPIRHCSLILHCNHRSPISVYDFSANPHSPILHCGRSSSHCGLLRNLVVEVSYCGETVGGGCLLRELSPLLRGRAGCCVTRNSIVAARCSIIAREAIGGGCRGGVEEKAASTGSTLAHGHSLDQEFIGPFASKSSKPLSMASKLQLPAPYDSKSNWLAS
ncbi:hypothetical protein V8G54_035367 [Vigna mungo]|uniref:Uncharacterized protein n=1 Tax=Vigna mungo TaxID=3915 RepID=A0AAQ3RAQ5_VIGMU